MNEKLRVEGTVKLLSITPKIDSNSMDACWKKIGTVFVSLVSTLCGKINFQGTYLIRLINPICGSTLCTGNLILMISGINALSLGLLGNVVCDRFRLAWFVTQALWAHYVKCWFSFVFGVKVLQIYSRQSLHQQVSFVLGLSTCLFVLCFN